MSGDQKALPFIQRAAADPTKKIQKEAATLMRIFYVAKPELFTTGWSWYLLTGILSGLVSLLCYLVFFMGTYYKDHSLVISYSIITVAGIGVVYELTKRFNYMLHGIALLAGGLFAGGVFSWLFFYFHPQYSNEIYPLFMASIAQIGLLMAACKIILRRSKPLARILLLAVLSGFGGLLAVVVAGVQFGPNNFIYCFLNALMLGLLSERFALAPHIFMRYARFGE